MKNHSRLNPPAAGRMRWMSFCVSMLALHASPAAQSCQLAVDINSTPSPFSSQPSWAAEPYIVAGNYTFFRATDPIAGREMWRTDGTAAGTILLKDIVAGQGHSVPWNLARSMAAVQVAGTWKVFFVAMSFAEGRELWVSDGTPAGTQLVKDINPGPDGALLDQLCAWNGKVYFAAFTTATGLELWKSDGTAAGTQLVADIATGAAHSAPSHLHVNPAGTGLLFQARSATNQYALYGSGGTAATTGVIANIGSVGVYGSPNSFVNVGTRTLFVADVSGSGPELWVTDGTAVGTQLLEIEPGSMGSWPSLLESAVVGGTVYFPATTSTGGRELWSSDGTAAGTVQVVDMVAGTGSSDPENLTDLGGVLAFAASTPATGEEPWILSGNIPVLLGDLQPGTGSSNPDNIKLVGNSLMITATINGVRSVYSIVAGVGIVQLAPVTTPVSMEELGGGRFIFTAEGADGFEPWLTDGTVAGTYQIKNIGVGMQTPASFPTDPRATRNGAIFVSATDGTSGHEPWVWRPGSAPVLLGDISTSDSFPLLIAEAESFSLFTAQTLSPQRQPYAWHHATDTITQLSVGGLTETTNGSGGIGLGDVILFSATDGVIGHELWITDGTPAGTSLLLDINPGSASSRPRDFIFYRGRVLFTARTAGEGRELWSTDGTATGTQLLLDINPGNYSSSPQFYTEFQGDMWFRATTAQYGTELMKTDGTAAGTTIGVDLFAGPSGSFPTSCIRVGDQLLFTGSTFATGTELFVTDGTSAGTSLVKDVKPGSSGGCNYAWLVKAGSKVFFLGDDGVAGRELWVTDLTTAGTYLVRDLSPLSTSGSLSGGMVAMGNYVYFGASTPDRPNSVWTSDGTSAGTLPVCGMQTHTTVFSAYSSARMNGVLYASMIDVAGSLELVAVTNAGALVEDLGDRCGLAWSFIEASPPVLGSNMVISGYEAPAGHIGVTLLANGSPGRIQLPNLLRPGCWSHAVPFDLLLPPTITTEWQHSVPIPLTPTLTGLALTIQTVYLQSLGQPMETSNALRATLGR